jgi:hypothetical protein
MAETIVLENGLVYWTAERIKKNGEKVPALYCVPVDGSRPARRLADNVREVAGNGEGRLWGTVISKESGTGVSEITEAGGFLPVLKKRPQGFLGGAIGAGGDWVGWTLERPSFSGAEPPDDPQDQGSDVWLYLKNTRDGSLVEIATRSDGITTPISISNDYVAWGNGSGWGDSGEYLAHLREGWIWRIDDNEGASIISVAAQAVAWRSDFDLDGTELEFPLNKVAFLQE